MVYAVCIVALSFFSKVDIFEENVILRHILHGFCLIGYKSINRRSSFK